jgi:tRNA-specific 2-thiouridylase
VDLLRGADPNKDQSYFLALMEQRQVSRALFPIGEILKPRVRELAREFGLPNAEKKDSQGICFIGEVKMSDFLRTFVEDRPGDIVGLDGKKLGQHQGLHLYTLGQRRGVGVPSNTYGEAYVVVAKRGETNELVVAFDKPETPMLYADRCHVGTISFANGVPDSGAEWRAQPRYRSEASRITFEADGDGGAEVVFERPRRALTPGQICAFYEGDRMLGGGFFTEIHHG